MCMNPHELSLAPLALKERVGPSLQADRENAEVQAGKENVGSTRKMINFHMPF